MSILHFWDEVPFTLRRDANVFLTLHDLQGKLLQRFEVGRYSPGEYASKFDLSGMPNGTYVCALHADGQVQSQVFQIQY